MKNNSDQNTQAAMMEAGEIVTDGIESAEIIPFPGRKIHFASLANVAGVFLFYVYYRFMNPDPVVSSFWRSSMSANMLYFLLAIVPFFVIGGIMSSKNKWVKKTVQKGRSSWSREDVAGLLDYLFQQPRLYFIFSFSAWAFEGALWGFLGSYWGSKSFGEGVLTTFLGSLVSGAVAATIAYIIADRFARDEIMKIFPQLESLNRPVQFSLQKIGLVMLCVVGVMPVLMTTYLSTTHAEHAILANDISRLALLRNTNLAIVGLSVFLTIMAMGWITRSISRPLVQMAELVKKVSARDFTSHMPVVTDDEIGYVSSGMNQMIRELSELYRSLERKVEERTEQLNQALHEVEMSNKRIVDSIQYSKRIQHSLLPDPEQIRSFLPENFILWLPRDVVGGDIYYAESFGDGYVVAVIDCTGHGVPGALMTMLAASELRRILVDEACLNPADILQRMNSNIKQLLHQDTQSAQSDDGLDASICYIDKAEKQLIFAGARQSLTYAQDSLITTVKGDRHSIGYKRSNLDFVFTNHTIDTSRDTTIYLYSDGFIDQLGGAKRLPFGNSRFCNVLERVQSHSLPDQKEAILESFHEHCGENEVQDDITVVGFRV